jgi:hypothetical protein
LELENGGKATKSSFFVYRSSFTYFMDKGGEGKGKMKKEVRERRGERKLKRAR